MESDNIAVTNLSVSYAGRLKVGILFCLLCYTETDFEGLNVNVAN